MQMAVINVLRVNALSDETAQVLPPHVRSVYLSDSLAHLIIY